jgi:hypothetical protein
MEGTPELDTLKESLVVEALVNIARKEELQKRRAAAALRHSLQPKKQQRYPPAP